MESGWISRGAEPENSIRMDSAKAYRYMAEDTSETNPNRIPKEFYKTCIGSTVNEVEEYLSARIQRFTETNGKPDGENFLFTQKNMSKKDTMEKIVEVLQQREWNQETDKIF